MNLKMYAIYDKLQTTYMTPMFQHNDGTALRMVQEAVNDTNSYLYKNPQDYALYRVGEWIDSSGELIPEEAKKVVEMVELVDHDKRADESEVEKLMSEVKQMRSVLDSLKTLVVGKNQAA